MAARRGCRLLRPVLVSGVLLATNPVMGQAPVPVCDRLSAARQLIDQRLRDSKTCTESGVAKGWTDCRFQAGDTVLRLVGALGLTDAERVRGIWGSGFYIDSVDPKHTVRIVVNDTLGMMLRVDSRDKLEPTGCLYNEAHVTLNAQVLSSGDLNMMLYKATGQDPIRTLQEALIDLGYFDGPVDGRVGAKMQAALRRYRAAKNIPATASDEQVSQLVLLDAARKAAERLKENYERVGPQPPDRR